MSVVRTLTAGELASYAGVYRTGSEWVVYGCVMAVLGVMFFGIVMTTAVQLALPLWLSIGLASAAASAAIATIVVQARSFTVIDAESIRYESPLRFLGWSVPLKDIVRCEVISRRAKELRIVTATRIRTINLTYEQWALLRPE